MKEVFLTPEAFDVYLELGVGAVALRAPQVDAFMRVHLSYGDIHSSYHPKDSVRLLVPKILDGIAARTASAPPAESSAFYELNRMFIVSTFAILQDTKTYNKIATKPVIQFFRHVRNACAHSGSFNFTKLQHPAKWRDKELTMQLVGKRVFPAVMADGDVFLLVLDVCREFYVPIVAE